MDQNNEVFNPNDKEQLREFINEVITDRFMTYAKSQEEIPVI